MWLLAARPPTLPAAVAPVLVGTAVATIDGPFSVGLFFQVLVAAILIQIGVNFANDLSDFRRGADTPERLGPPRAVAQGWLTERQMLGGAVVVFGGAGRDRDLADDRRRLADSGRRRGLVHRRGGVHRRPLAVRLSRARRRDLLRLLWRRRRDGLGLRAGAAN